jgi:phosphatidylglycerophosphate synthase
MNLHRVQEKPDWEYVPREEWNVWQRTAARTDGWVTPGNITTVIGTGITLAGLAYVSEGHMARGAALVGVGRVLDLVDGRLADKTGTKSPRGEAMDAGADKILIGAGVAAGMRMGVIPIAAGTALLTQQAAISAVSAAARLREQQVHPERSGKLAMTAAWLSIGGYLLGNSAALDRDSQEVLQTSSHVAAGASLAFGAKALYHYGRRAFRRTEDLSS